MVEAIRKFYSVYRSHRSEKKLIFILLFCAGFTQIHQIAHLLPDGKTWLGITLTNWPSWSILTGVFFFLFSSVLVAMVLLVTLPPTVPKRYHILIITLIVVNGVEIINLLLDRPETAESDFFHPAYTALPLSLIAIYMIRRVVKSSPSEQNRYLRSEVSDLKEALTHITYSDLVLLFEDTNFTKHCAVAMRESHSLKSWKSVLEDQTSETLIHVSEAIKTGRRTLEKDFEG